MAEHRSDRAIDIPDGQVNDDRIAPFKRSVRRFDESVVEVLVKPVILLPCVPPRLISGHLGPAQDRREVKTLGFPVPQCLVDIEG